MSDYNCHSLHQQREMSFENLGGRWLLFEAETQCAAPYCLYCAVARVCLSPHFFIDQLTLAPILSESISFFELNEALVAVKYQNLKLDSPKKRKPKRPRKKQKRVQERKSLRKTSPKLFLRTYDQSLELKKKSRRLLKWSECTA